MQVHYVLKEGKKWMYYVLVDGSEGGHYVPEIGRKGFSMFLRKEKLIVFSWMGRR